MLKSRVVARSSRACSGRRSAQLKILDSVLGERANAHTLPPDISTRPNTQDSDPNWMAGLTPMTRLILAAGLSSVGVGSVHFIDGTHSFLSFSTSTSETEGGVEGEVGLRGAESVSSFPRSAHMGVLHMDEYAYESQFVISPSQRLWERLVVSAPLETVNGGEGGVSGTEGGMTIGSPGPDGPECVKYIAEVRLWEERRRETWFPNGPQDARSLQLALHNFCPISWLEEEGSDGGGEDLWVGEGGRGGVLGGNRAHYNSQPRKVVIYQRDRDRRMLNSNEVGSVLMCSYFCLMDVLNSMFVVFSSPRRCKHGHIGFTLTVFLSPHKGHKSAPPVALILDNIVFSASSR